MKKRKALLAMALAMALSLTACWGGGDKKSSNQGTSGQTPASGVKAEISVQAEEAWVPYYEAAIQRVKEKIQMRRSPFERSVPLNTWIRLTTRMRRTRM